MSPRIKEYSELVVSGLLRSRGVNPTPHRVLIAQILFERWTHLSAEEVHSMANGCGGRVSKATVYNTLGLLVEKGVVREVVADRTKVFYDPNTEPHHHFYDVATGQLRDIDADNVHVSNLPSLPQGAILEGIDIVVRVRNLK